LDNHDTRSTCPTSVFTGTGQTLMSRPEQSMGRLVAPHYPDSEPTNLCSYGLTLTA